MRYLIFNPPRHVVLEFSFVVKLGKDKIIAVEHVLHLLISYGTRELWFLLFLVLDKDGETMLIAKMLL